MTAIDALLVAAAANPEIEVGKGVEETSILEAERELGSSFPADYRGFLTSAGWAAIGPWEIAGLGPELPRYLDVVELTQAERKDGFVPRHVVVIANDGGGNVTVLDPEGRSGHPGAVLFIDHEDGTEKRLFPSFSELIKYWLGKLETGAAPY